MDTQSTLALPDLPGMGHGWELLLPQDEVSRRCTADVAVKLDEQREAIKRACVHIGTRRVAEAFGISREVVRAIRAEAVRTGELDQFKEEHGRRCLAVADRLMDRLEDEVDKLPIGSVPLSIAILTDKGQLLTGSPTSRVQHEHVRGVAEIADYIDSLPAAQPVWGEGNDSQKGGSAASGAIDLAALPAPAEQAKDSQSLVSAQDAREIEVCGSEDGRIDPKKGNES